MHIHYKSKSDPRYVLHTYFNSFEHNVNKINVNKNFRKTGKIHHPFQLPSKWRYWR